jgi:hypothetical protein
MQIPEDCLSSVTALAQHHGSLGSGTDPFGMSRLQSAQLISS